jgi:hypothetical protein
MAKPRTAKDTAARLLLQTQALALRAHGHTFRGISRTLNIGATTAHTLVKSAMAAERKYISEAKADYIELEIHRLDTYLQALAKKVQGGEPRAVDTALRIGERRARLLGLDAPVRVDQNVKATVEATTEAFRTMGYDLDRLDLDQLSALDGILQAATPAEEPAAPAEEA